MKILLWHLMIMVIIIMIIFFVVIPGLLVYGTLVPNAQLLGPVITCFEPEGNEVWLTIDDGPADDTMQVLDAGRLVHLDDIRIG